MATCEVCGNEDERAFTILVDGEAHVFDAFECAIHQLAPECGHCGCKVVGHGVATAGGFYCCEHCVRAEAAVAGPERFPSVA
jgi:hypothetical protein